MVELPVVLQVRLGRREAELCVRLSKGIALPRREGWEEDEYWCAEGTECNNQDEN